MTTLLTATADPQRGERLAADPSAFATLAASTERHGVPLIVLADELDMIETSPLVHVVPVDADGVNPYIARWRLIAGWLDRTVGLDKVFCVDATDVELLNDPFRHMRPGALYIGSEPNLIGSGWMAKLHPSADGFVVRHRNLPMFNAGIVGADAATMRTFLMLLLPRLVVAEDAGDLTDMAAINEVVWALHDAATIVTGSPVHTVFRADDRTNQRCWWRHK